MFALTLLAVFAVVVMFGYITRQQNRIAVLESDLAWVYEDRDESIAEWIDYTEQLKDQIRLYTPIIVDYQIAKKQRSAAKLGKVNLVGNSGKTRQRSVYALSMFDQPVGYDPIMDEDGHIDYVKVPEIVKAESVAAVADTPAQSSNGNKQNNDAGSFDPVSDDKSFYELVDLIMADRKVKKLPKDQFEWLKEKYTAWQKNPADNAEYKKRFDGRFAK